jgi:methylthioribulose-1-phosphate dehydratase
MRMLDHDLACVLTSDQNAVVASLMYDKEFRITNQKMLAGIRKGSSKTNFSYYDTCVIPIIEFTENEQDLKDRLLQARIAYPEANAVLVRGFGLYVWESTLLSFRMTQCYDRLFAIAIKMRSMGMDLAKIHPVNHY